MRALKTRLATYFVRAPISDSILGVGAHHEWHEIGSMGAIARWSVRREQFSHRHSWLEYHHGHQPENRERDLVAGVLAIQVRMEGSKRRPRLGRRGRRTPRHFSAPPGASRPDLVPVLVVAEVAYLLATRRSAPSTPPSWQLRSALASGPSRPSIGATSASSGLGTSMPATRPGDPGYPCRDGLLVAGVSAAVPDVADQDRPVVRHPARRSCRRSRHRAGRRGDRKRSRHGDRRRGDRDEDTARTTP